MLINSNFSLRATVTPDTYQWVGSPQSGVERVMLDRIGEEIARATSLVRYQPHSYFPRHEHPRGEEILVLSGIFSEGNNHYPAGWYLRNPPGSSHQPASAEGALILVKLGQMHVHNNEKVRINTQDASSWHEQDWGLICPLFSDDTEKVCLQCLPLERQVFHQPVTLGAELYVINGALREGDRLYPAGSWLRLPCDIFPSIIAAINNTLIYLKTEHMLHTVMQDPHHV